MRRYDPHLLLNADSPSDFLKREFVRRLDHNSHYSLRAFARDLDLSPSRLSESMNKKSGVSLKTIEKISIRLKLTPSERAVLRDLYLLQGRKNRGAQELARKNISVVRERAKTKRLDSEKFKVISEWYHAAILQMTELKQFQPKVDWIADQLGLSPERTRLAIERLINVGLLKTEGARWQQSPDLQIAESEIPSKAIRAYHKQMLQKAFRAIDHIEIDRRFVQSMTLAIPGSRYKEVCQKIQALLQETWESTDLPEKSQLYAINIQFVPLLKEDSL